MTASKSLTFDEYKAIHKKMTNPQRAYYETQFGYRTKLLKEIEHQELEDFKQMIQAKVEEIKQQIKDNSDKRD